MAKAAISQTPKQQPQLVVDIRKLIVLCLVSGGLYQLYWFYKQWQSVLPPETTGWRLVVYAVFGTISSFDLFKRLKSPYAPSLATAYLLLPATLSLLARPFDLLSYVAITVPIVMVQQTVNQEHHTVMPDSKVYGFEIVLVLIGALGITFALTMPR